MSALEIIGLYGLRFKIEVSFKQAIHTVGTYLYHFWMSGMKPLRRKNGNQYMHHESPEFLLTGTIAVNLVKFIRKRLDLSRKNCFKQAA
ncbi:MAG: hypothetical protein KAS17_06340 [Victivallaceae bacterium]|nr:hypothetical protein [Victivallaceae bacterium]